MKSIKPFMPRQGIQPTIHNISMLSDVPENAPYYQDSDITFKNEQSGDFLLMLLDLLRQFKAQSSVQNISISGGNTSLIRNNISNVVNNFRSLPSSSAQVKILLNNISNAFSEGGDISEENTDYLINQLTEQVKSLSLNALHNANTSDITLNSQNIDAQKLISALKKNSDLSISELFYSNSIFAEETANLFTRNTVLLNANKQDINNSKNIYSLAQLSLKKSSENNILSEISQKSKISNVFFNNNKINAENYHKINRTETSDISLVLAENSSVNIQKNNTVYTKLHKSIYSSNANQSKNSNIFSDFNKLDVSTNNASAYIKNINTQAQKSFIATTSQIAKTQKFSDYIENAFFSNDTNKNTEYSWQIKKYIADGEKSLGNTIVKAKFPLISYESKTENSFSLPNNASISTTYRLLNRENFISDNLKLHNTLNIKKDIFSSKISTDFTKSEKFYYTSAFRNGNKSFPTENFQISNNAYEQNNENTFFAAPQFVENSNIENNLKSAVEALYSYKSKIAETNNLEIVKNTSKHTFNKKSAEETLKTFLNNTSLFTDNAFISRLSDEAFNYANEINNVGDKKEKIFAAKNLTLENIQQSANINQNRSWEFFKEAFSDEIFNNSVNSEAFLRKTNSEIKFELVKNKADFSKRYEAFKNFINSKKTSTANLNVLSSIATELFLTRNSENKFNSENNNINRIFSAFLHKQNQEVEFKLFQYNETGKNYLEKKQYSDNFFEWINNSDSQLVNRSVISDLTKNIDFVNMKHESKAEKQIEQAFFSNLRQQAEKILSSDTEIKHSVIDFSNANVVDNYSNDFVNNLQNFIDKRKNTITASGNIVSKFSKILEQNNGISQYNIAVKSVKNQSENSNNSILYRIENEAVSNYSHILNELFSKKAENFSEQLFSNEDKFHLFVNKYLSRYNKADSYAIVDIKHNNKLISSSINRNILNPSAKYPIANEFNSFLSNSTRKMPLYRNLFVSNKNNQSKNVQGLTVYDFNNADLSYNKSFINKPTETDKRHYVSENNALSFAILTNVGKNAVENYINKIKSDLKLNISDYKNSLSSSSDEHSKNHFYNTSDLLLQKNTSFDIAENSANRNINTSFTNDFLYKNIANQIKASHRNEANIDNSYVYASEKHNNNNSMNDEHLSTDLTLKIESNNTNNNIRAFHFKNITALKKYLNKSSEARKMLALSKKYSNSQSYKLNNQNYDYLSAPLLSDYTAKNIFSQNMMKDISDNLDLVNEFKKTVFGNQYKEYISLFNKSNINEYNAVFKKLNDKKISNLINVQKQNTHDKSDIFFADELRNIVDVVKRTYHKGNSKLSINKKYSDFLSFKQGIFPLKNFVDNQTDIIKQGKEENKYFTSQYNPSSQKIYNSDTEYNESFAENRNTDNVFIYANKNTEKEEKISVDEQTAIQPVAVSEHSNSEVDFEHDKLREYVNTQIEKYFSKQKNSITENHSSVEMICDRVIDKLEQRIKTESRLIGR